MKNNENMLLSSINAFVTLVNTPCFLFIQFAILKGLGDSISYVPWIVYWVYLLLFIFAVVVNVIGGLIDGMTTTR